jgi:hypothetical protein
LIEATRPKPVATANQLGTGLTASPAESPRIKSRPKQDTKARKHAAFTHAKSKLQTPMRARELRANRKNLRRNQKSPALWRGFSGRAHRPDEG